jgi:hypothetical protein
METVIISQDEQGFEVRKVGYFSRIVGYFKSIWVVYVIVLGSISFISSFINALYICGVLILWNLIEFSGRTKYLILKIAKEGDLLRIDYLSGSNTRSVEGKRSDFIFSKKHLWYKVKVPVVYLSVLYKGGLVIKQYSFGDLDEKVFDQLINHFSGVPGRHSSAPDAP